MTEDEIRTILEHNGFENKAIDQLIDTNNAIAESIQTAIDLNQALFPNYETPEDVKAIYEQYKDKLIINE